MLKRLLFFTSLLALVAADAPPAGWTADPKVVADFKKRRPNVTIDESAVPPYTLPDALKRANGDIVKTAAEWSARRAEILELFRSQMFGRPFGKPQSLTFETIEKNEKALNGAATLKRIAIVSQHGGRRHRFVLALFLPNARKSPAPVFLLLNNRNPEENTDATRKNKSPFWPVEQIIARGYGIAAIQNNELAPDVKTNDAAYRKGIIELFEGPCTGKRAPDACMAIAAWAWGASRAMDYFETDKAVDAKHVAIIGHSRGGKTALWAAAEDERFALAISNNSGSCGAAISRRRFGERIALTHTNPHWFCDNFRKYHDREDDLPFDQHELIALIAPRPVYIASATEDLWADPRGEFLGLANANSVYALFNAPEIPLDAMPAADTPIVFGPRAYHIRTGPHNLTEYDWQRYADFADRVWK